VLRSSHQGTHRLVPTLRGLGAEDLSWCKLALSDIHVGARLPELQVLYADSLTQLVPRRRHCDVNSRAIRPGRYSVSIICASLSAGPGNVARWWHPRVLPGLGWEPSRSRYCIVGVRRDHTGLRGGALAVSRALAAGYRAGFVAGDAAVVCALLAVRQHGRMLLPRPVHFVHGRRLGRRPPRAEQRDPLPPTPDALLRIPLAGFTVYIPTPCCIMFTRGEACRDTVRLGWRNAASWRRPGSSTVRGVPGMSGGVDHHR